MGLLTVEVVIISAQDLKSSKLGVLFGGKMSPFVVAWVPGYSSSSRNVVRNAPHATQGGPRHPTWNSRQTFSCDEDALSQGRVNLTIEVRHKRLFFFKEKLLGTVKLPLSLNYRSDTPTALTEQIMLPSRQKQGILNFSVKISEAPKLATPRAVVAPALKGPYLGYDTGSGSAGGGVKSFGSGGGDSGGGHQSHRACHVESQHGDGGGCGGWDGGGDGGGGWGGD